MLDRLSHCRYGHPDLKKAEEFFTDFGLIPVLKKNDKIYFRGFGRDQFCYVAEKTEDGRRKFKGGGWIVQSMAELEKAAKLPGSTPIHDSDAPGGGKVVIVKDLLGEEITLIYGQQDRVPDAREVPKPVMWNTWEDKKRLGEFQRPERDSPSKVHKLGHYGFEVNIDKIHEVFGWYCKTFNMKKTDTLFQPQTNKTCMIFIHLDKGKEFVDHHVRAFEPRFFRVIMLTTDRISSSPALPKSRRESRRTIPASRWTTLTAKLSGTTTYAVRSTSMFLELGDTCLVARSSITGRQLTLFCRMRLS